MGWSHGGHHQYQITRRNNVRTNYWTHGKKISSIFFFLFRSFFQSVCVLGYCLLPLSIALALCRIVLLLQQNTLFFVLRCGFSLTAFFWAVWGMSLFIHIEICTFIINVLVFIYGYSGYQIFRRFFPTSSENLGWVPDWIILLCHRLARRFTFQFLNIYHVYSQFAHARLQNKLT